MSLKIGIGTNMRIQSAFNWLTYWVTRYPSLLTATAISDVRIDLAWTNNGDVDYDGVSIERSLDGITYAEIITIAAGSVAYSNIGLTADTLYYYRIRYYRGTHYSAYSNVDSDTTFYNMLLTSTGTGVGVSTLIMQVAVNMTLTLGANAKFYTDAAGTLGESATWAIVSGADRTIYLKCTTGTATMTFPNPANVTRWPLWVSGVNAASIAGNISKLSALTYVEVGGNNTLSGSITALTSLTHVVISGLNTLSGSIAALTSLTFLRVYGSNTLSGSVTALISLTVLHVTGFNTLSGDLNPVVSDLIICTLDPCAMIDYTAGATWGNTTIMINPSAGYGYDSTEIDNMLIDMAASVALISKVITLQGSSAARTAASNAAVLTLEGAGRLNTVVTN